MLLVSGDNNQLISIPTHRPKRRHHHPRHVKMTRMEQMERIVVTKKVPPPTHSSTMPTNIRRNQPIFITTTKSIPAGRTTKITNLPSKPNREKSSVGEMAGGAAAECAAIWCCCPCLVMDVIILTVFKVPTGLVRRMRKKYNQKRLLRRSRKGLLTAQSSSAVANCEDEEFMITSSPTFAAADFDFKDFELLKLSIQGSEVVELDKEMWEQFYNTGFWRSPSQKGL